MPADTKGISAAVGRGGKDSSQGEDIAMAEPGGRASPHDRNPYSFLVLDHLFNLIHASQ